MLLFLQFERRSGRCIDMILRTKIKSCCFALMAAAFCVPVHGVIPRCYPDSSYVKGGVPLLIDGFRDGWVLEKLYFGDVEAADLAEDHYYCLPQETKGVDCIYVYRCVAPPQLQAGDFLVTAVYKSGISVALQEPFTYYASPVIDRILPDANSISPVDDDAQITVSAFGVSLEPGVKVYFDEQPANIVDVELVSPWINIICVPFSSGGWRTSSGVDVRIVNGDGSEGVLSNAFHFRALVPTVQFVFPENLAGWTEASFRIGLRVDNPINGPAQVYFDGIPGTLTTVSVQQSTIYTLPPAHAPGRVPLTVVNGDGGKFTLADGFNYTGTPISDFHAGDQNQDFRFSLQELLRVIQYYNADGYHCDPGSEDGYAPGPGDRSCTPYSSDHEPQDWRIGLAEVMEIIEFYNLHCYQPCPGAPGTYCPPTPAS